MNTHTHTQTVPAAPRPISVCHRLRGHDLAECPIEACSPCVMQLACCRAIPQPRCSSSVTCRREPLGAESFHIALTPLQEGVNRASTPTTLARPLIAQPSLFMPAAALTTRYSVIAAHGVLKSGCFQYARCAWRVVHSGSETQKNAQSAQSKDVKR